MDRLRINGQREKIVRRPDMKQRRTLKGKQNRKPVRGHKHRKEIMLCQLQIQIQETIVTCTVPVIEAKIVRSQGVFKRNIYTKRKYTYKIIGKSYKSEWKIEKINTPYITPSGLINSKVWISNGKRIQKGIIVKADIVGGGVSCPPASGGLPPVDE